MGLRLFKSSTVSATVTVCILVSLPVSAPAQSEKDRWQRVYTGEDSIIEVNTSSLSFEPKHILRVQFRTVFSKPENLQEKSGTKYKTRLETIEFKLISGYRLYATSLLDATGKTVQSYQANSSEDWKVMKDGGIMQRMFHAAQELPTLGIWKVVAYRFGDGTPPSAQEFKRTLGTRVRLHFDRAEVGVKVCSSPDYQSKPATDHRIFQQLGISFESIGIKASRADTIVVKCESNDWAPPQSLLVNLLDGDMLMLWDGIFLVLKKERY